MCQTPFSSATLAVAVASLGVLLGGRLLMPRFPFPLAVVAGGIAVSSVAGLEAHGVAVVGSIPAGLPELGLPDAGVSDAAELAPAALGIFLVTFADAILTARSYAGKHDQHVDASSQGLNLGPMPHAAEHNRDREVEIAAVGAEALRDLGRELARGAEHECPAALAVWRAAI